MTGRCSDNSYHSTPYLFGRAFRTPVFPLFFGRSVLFFRGFRGGGLVDLAVELVETVLRGDEIFRRLDRLGGSRDIVHGDEVLHFIVLKVVHELQRKQENETDGNGQKERAPDGEKPERNVHDDDEVDRRKEGGKAAPESLAGAHGVFVKPHKHITDSRIKVLIYMQSSQAERYGVRLYGKYRPRITKSEI